jgi:hypothetical protein
MVALDSARDGSRGGEPVEPLSPAVSLYPAVSYETKRGDTAKQSDGGRKDSIVAIAKTSHAELQKTVLVCEPHYFNL